MKRKCKYFCTYSGRGEDLKRFLQNAKTCQARSKVGYTCFGSFFFFAQSSQSKSTMSLSSQTSHVLLQKMFGISLVLVPLGTTQRSCSSRSPLGEKTISVHLSPLLGAKILFDSFSPILPLPRHHLHATNLVVGFQNMQSLKEKYGAMFWLVMERLAPVATYPT